MIHYTVLADIAGRISRDTVNPWATVGGVALLSDDVDRIRSALPAGLPKWRDCTFAQAEEVARLIAREATGAAVISTNFDTPAWPKFWEEAQLLGAAQTRQDKRKPGLVKATNMARCLMFMDGVTMATSCAIGHAFPSGVVQSKDVEIVAQTLVFDAELGGETREFFLDFWKVQHDQPKTRSIGFAFTNNSVCLSTEEDEPLLLLPDYLAGLGQCAVIDNPGRIKLPLTQQEAQHCLRLISNDGRVILQGRVFNLDYREIFGNVMDLAGI